MRKCVAVLAVLGIAALPALAGPSVATLKTPTFIEITPVTLGQPIGSPRTADVYDAYSGLQSFTGGFISPELGDDVHLTQATFTHVHWLAQTSNAVNPGGTHNQIIWFYDNTAANFGAVNGSSITVPFLTGFNIGGIPNSGTFLITVGISSAIVGNAGPDMFVSLEQLPGTPAAQNTAIAGGAVPTIGTSADLMFTWYSPSSFYDGVGLGVGLANLAFGFGVPEPATIALLAFGGFAILRRRR